ncbi:hypothetical protein COLO4_30805 [Corchorus olitorius]|uniref:Uncharacterized protein n=1 Tax=Corchorus olitorius TaxID=93759 RepID=A0A1R3H6S6_9ROSI|nr:hypothetical protein COLO4_30805 [Corchorus olitorius]
MAFGPLSKLGYLSTGGVLGKDDADIMRKDDAIMVKTANFYRV